MEGHEASSFRALAARLNYLAVDRADILFASKEVSRGMSNPKNGNWEGLKRLCRYLISTPRLVHFYEWQEMPRHLSVYCDSDWAGCRKTRKSTSGGCFMHGTHLLKAYAKTQANIALSSGGGRVL